MPDIITHYKLGAAVWARLAPKQRERLDRAIFDSATPGPDIWFSYRFWWPKGQAGKPARGDEMQHRQTGAFLLALAEQAREDGENRYALFSYLAGFLCHYALDRTTHPYIVYRSGEYDGTEATRVSRGAHMRLEHALDLRALRAWNSRTGARRVTRRILRLRRLPSSLRPGLDAAYAQVYGWPGAWADLNRGLADQRRFYLLTQDPTGLLDAILRRVDDGVGLRDYTAYPYFGKECPGVDVANEARAPWRHPCDPAILSRETFDDLYRRAAREAARMIAAVQTFFLDGDAARLAGVLGDASYETGFDWRDPRNEIAPLCDPLPLRQQNNRKG